MYGAYGRIGKSLSRQHRAEKHVLARFQIAAVLQHQWQVFIQQPQGCFFYAILHTSTVKIIQATDMRLEVFDLELILHIAKTGSLTQAAQCAAISLQAASERLKKIEQQFDVKLFSRHSTGTQLTLAGQSFLEHAQGIVQRSHALQQHMLQFSSQYKQQLCLWCNSSAQSEYLPKILPEYLLQCLLPCSS